MSVNLPEAASLEHLKNQAKALRKAVDAHDQTALDRVRAAHPRPLDKPTLADCQLVVAREYGFDSWPKLKAHVEELEYARVVEQFKSAVEASQSATVASLLRKNPKLRRNVDAPLFSFDTPAIVRAAGKNDRATIDMLLEAGANVNARTSWKAGGFGILDNAAADTAAYLISRGAQVDIHAAAKHGMIDRVQELVTDNPALVNARGGDGMTPLHVASTIEICAYLLDHGASIDIRDIDHNATPAQYAMRDTKKLRYLVDRGAQADIFIVCRLGDRALAAAVMDRHPDCLRWRLNHPDYRHSAGHIYLYELGQAVRPITLAVDHGGLEFIAYLLARGVELDCLLLGCAMARRGLVESIVSSSPDFLAMMTDDDKALISDSAWENRIDTVRVMLDAGFPIDARGFEDGTALERAAMRGWAPLVRLLIDKGASLDAVNKYGGSPLAASIWGSENWPRQQGDHAACVQALIDAGSTLPERLWGSPEVRAILKQHGVPE